MPFEIEEQEQDMWCWAAVSVSVDRYFSPASPSTQCGIARNVLNVADCCANPEICDTPARLQDALRVVGRFRKKFASHLSFEDIRDQIDASMPVCVRIGWFGGGGHFVVISGYSETPAGEQFVIVKDPLFADSTLLYDEFVSAYQSGSGEWTGTFLVEQ